MEGKSPTLNISVNITLKNYDSQGLIEKLKLMGEAMKFFSKKVLGHEIFSSMVPGLQNIFQKNCKSLGPPSLSHAYIMCTPKSLMYKLKKLYFSFDLNNVVIFSNYGYRVLTFFTLSRLLVSYISP